MIGTAPALSAVAALFGTAPLRSVRSAVHVRNGRSAAAAAVCTRRYSATTGVRRGHRFRLTRRNAVAREPHWPYLHTKSVRTPPPSTAAAPTPSASTEESAASATIHLFILQRHRERIESPVRSARGHALPPGCVRACGSMYLPRPYCVRYRQGLSHVLSCCHHTGVLPPTHE